MNNTTWVEQLSAWWAVAASVSTLAMLIGAIYAACVGAKTMKASQEASRAAVRQGATTSSRRAPTCT